MDSLHGKVALVTGAGGGIGRATALELGARGARVAVHYRRSRQGAEQVVCEISQRGGGAAAFQADVTSARDVQVMVAAVEERFGRIDLLVNNAGDLLERRPLARLDAEFVHAIMDVNVTSAALCTQAVAPGMIDRRSGAIVNLSSVAAHNGGGPGACMYAAAKAAVIALTKGLAKDLAPHGIRVNCVSPGLIGATEFHARFTQPDAFAAAEKGIPLGRAGTPAEVARVIAFLASEDASYLCGETIEINGGMFMR